MFYRKQLQVMKETGVVDTIIENSKR